MDDEVFVQVISATGFTDLYKNSIPRYVNKNTCNFCEGRLESAHRIREGLFWL